MKDKLAGKIIGKHYEPLTEWQKRNCSGCKFADGKTVGTGEACCTYYLIFKQDNNGECTTRKIVDSGK